MTYFRTTVAAAASAVVIVTVETWQLGSLQACGLGLPSAATVSAAWHQPHPSLCMGSVVVVYRLSSSVAWVIFPDQEWTWIGRQILAYPLDHQKYLCLTFTNCKSFSLDFKICFIIFLWISVSKWIFQCSQADGLHDTLTGLVVCIGVKFFLL